MSATGDSAAARVRALAQNLGQLAAELFQSRVLPLGWTALQCDVEGCFCIFLPPEDEYYYMDCWDFGVPFPGDAEAAPDPQEDCG